jgi:dTDP-4-amino-4,6-dideoxygalactose transaminase
VILPAYTCPTVGRAVQAAGLQGLCADISLGDFAIAPDAVEQLLDDKVLAVIAPHMFGTACDVRTLSELAKMHGAVLIEDLAQAFGAHCHGREVGTYGGIGFNSLGRSKNVRGYRGGVLWVNHPDLVSTVEEEYAGLPAPPSAVLLEQIKQLATIGLSRPTAWDIARRVPFLRVGSEDQSFEDRPTRLAAWQAALGLISLRRVDEYNSIRQRFGASLSRTLAGIEGFEVQIPSPGCDSTFLRVALRVSASPVSRDALVQRLQQHGIDARAFYTRVMPEYEWWRRDGRQMSCPAAETLLDSNLILPVCHGTSVPEVGWMLQVIGEYASR